MLRSRELCKTPPNARRRRGARFTAPALLALTAALALLAAPVQADNYDLPIGTQLNETDPEPLPAPPVEEDEDAPNFFDEELPDIDSIIYVVDRSSSMSLPSEPYIGLDGNIVQGATRLDYVKTELKRSINSLSSDFSFNLVIYDECVEAWKTARVRATPQSKAEAMAWIDAIQPWGWTNTGGATTRALADQQNHTVLLLSDGAPNYLDCAQSYVADFETHRTLIRQANRQEAVIHTFGIGLDQEARGFLREVASDNAGTFREVD